MRRTHLRRYGKHCSIAGGISKSLERAVEYGCNALQFFSRNPRGWASRPLSDEEAELFRETRVRLRLDPVAIHDNYLINLAAPPGRVRERSIEAFRDELVRAVRLGVDYVVMHPGSSMGITASRGVAACIDGIKEAASGLDLEGVTVLVENTAGQGDCVGRSYEEVADIVAGCEGHVPIGVCLDTAHTFAAGYELRSERGFRATMKAVRETFGYEKVRIIHFNDSKADFGSNVDRHWHIGEGKIGYEGLRRVARFRPLSHAALILETPVDATHRDEWNVARLAAMVTGRMEDGG